MAVIILISEKWKPLNIKNNNNNNSFLKAEATIINADITFMSIYTSTRAS